MIFLLVNKNTLHNRHYVPIPCMTCIWAHKNNSEFRNAQYVCKLHYTLTLHCIFSWFPFPSFLFFFISQSLHNCSLLSLVCILQKT